MCGRAREAQRAADENREKARRSGRGVGCGGVVHPVHQSSVLFLAAADDTNKFSLDSSAALEIVVNSSRKCRAHAPDTFCPTARKSFGVRRSHSRSAMPTKVDPNALCACTTERFRYLLFSPHLRFHQERKSLVAESLLVQHCVGQRGKINPFSWILTGRSLNPSASILRYSLTWFGTWFGITCLQRNGAEALVGTICPPRNVVH